MVSRGFARCPGGDGPQMARYAHWAATHRAQYDYAGGWPDRRKPDGDEDDDDAFKVTLLLLLLLLETAQWWPLWAALLSSLKGVNVRKQSYHHPAASSGNIFTWSKKGRIGLFHIPPVHKPHRPAAESSHLIYKRNRHKGRNVLCPGQTGREKGGDKASSSEKNIWILLSDALFADQL